MKIESIRLKSYKIFKDLRLDNLPQLVIFIGTYQLEIGQKNGLHYVNRELFNGANPK